MVHVVFALEEDVYEGGHEAIHKQVVVLLGEIGQSLKDITR